MSLIKVSIFQKNLNEGLNISVLKKIISVKSDILVLPEYFYADKNTKNFVDLKNSGKNALDWLLKLNQTYKGIIIGGSILIEKENELYNACPIIYNGDVIDWYYKRVLSDGDEKKYVKPGNDIGIFILNHIRFAVMIGNDAKQIQFYDDLKQQNVNLVFIVNLNYNEYSNEEEHLKDFKEEHNFYDKIAREKQFNIIKCDAVGTYLQKKLTGRSLLSTPKGISWHSTFNERENQILKHIMINN